MTGQADIPQDLPLPAEQQTARQAIVLPPGPSIRSPPAVSCLLSLPPLHPSASPELRSSGPRSGEIEDLRCFVWMARAHTTFFTFRHFYSEVMSYSADTKIAVPARIHLDCSLCLQGMRNLASSFVRSSPSYTGSTTLDESGCGSSTFFGMYAIVHVGKGTTCYQLLAKSASYYHLTAGCEHALGCISARAQVTGTRMHVSFAPTLLWWGMGLEA